MRLESVFLGSRVARRIFWLFVLSALVPLALSDWLAVSAVSDLAHGLERRSHVQSTRQATLQVYDRLGAARTALGSLPTDERHDTAGTDRLRHVEPMFSRVARVGVLETTSDAGREDMQLLALWSAADSGASGADPAPLEDAPVGLSTQVSLRLLASHPTAEPLVLLGAREQGRLTWLAELRPSYLWTPLTNAAVDSGWLVTDARRRVLTRAGDLTLIPAASTEPSTELPAVTVHRTTLLLAADLGAAEWEFAQWKRPPELRWQGLALGVWLSLLACATLLLIALVSMMQIRRTLVPLERLTQGTRRIAAGSSSTRVEISGADEFAALGRSFNDMAMRIEGQFRSLEGLASIDRDVLAGAPTVDVAERVVRQLGTAHVEVTVSLLWLLEATTNDALHLSRAAGIDTRVCRASRRLSSAEVEQVRQMVQDAVVQPGDLQGAPWQLPEGAASAVARLLPLRWDHQTQALLVLAGPAAACADLAGSAAEQRDRLTLAFASRAREREMVRRAGHDSLTGLANRHGLNEFVDALLRADSGVTACAVLFVDIDNFKDANDSLGHEIGDQVLCEASQRLGSCGPESALIARQGGDEFVLVLPGAREDAACSVAAEVVRMMAMPFHVGSDRHWFGASVGIAMHPAHGTSRQELLRRADMAMYAAKAAGRGRYALFEPSLETVTQRRLRLPNELRRALEHGELTAHYQPRICAGTGRVTSAEALVRWQHPEHGLLMPETFIGLAEESGLIEEIGRFMLNDACSRIAEWQRLHPRLERVSVNVSPRQLASSELPDVVRSVLAAHALPARALELEVTESLLVDDSRKAHAQLSELRRMGVSIALDDFGTGYSSLSMLRNLPIDVMKIDRAFVKDLSADAGAAAIIGTIASLAHALKLRLVAEGVENEQQAQALRAVGCHELQGYFYSRALSPANFGLYCAQADGLRPDAGAASVATADGCVARVSV